MTESVPDDIPIEFTHLSEEDLRDNSTLQSLEELRGHLSYLYHHREAIDSIVDIGCNRGRFAAALGDYLDVAEIYGIDIDEEMREHAEELGITTFDVNVETDRIPIDDNTIDLAVCFGLLEHLRYYDHLFGETHRMLDDGWFWISAPNLASWLNRFALLAGYQPRSIELSDERAVGTAPMYDRDVFLDHVHAPTYRALIELLEHHHFDPLDSAGLTPYQHSRLVQVLDVVFSVRTSWARRVAVLSKQR